MLMSGYAVSYGLKTVALRFTNVYGPGMTEKDSFVARLMKAARDGNEVEVFGDGEQLRDNLYVHDAVAAVELALKAPESDPLIVGTGRSITVNQLVALVRSVTGVDIAARNVPPKAGEMPAVVVDNSRARSRGWAPTVALDTGLRLTWEDFSRVAAPLGQV
jgi:UDP-glucose 4-epimerase